MDKLFELLQLTLTVVTTACFYFSLFCSFFFFFGGLVILGEPISPGMGMSEYK